MTKNKKNKYLYRHIMVLQKKNSFKAIKRKKNRYNDKIGMVEKTRGQR